MAAHKPEFITVFVRVRRNSNKTVQLRTCNFVTTYLTGIGLYPCRCFFSICSHIPTHDHAVLSSRQQHSLGACIAQRCYFVAAKLEKCLTSCHLEMFYGRQIVLLMPLKLVRRTLAPSDIPHYDALVETSRKQKLLLGIPCQCMNTPCMCFQRSD